MHFAENIAKRKDDIDEVLREAQLQSDETVRIFKKWISNISSLSTYLPRTLEEMMNFEMRGGLLRRDKIRYDLPFLHYFAHVVAGRVVIRPEFYEEFEAFRSYLIRGDLNLGIHQSLFIVPCATMLSLVGWPRDYNFENHASAVETQEIDSLKFVPYDLLGFFGDMLPYELDIDYDAYYHYVRSTYSVPEIVRRYRAHLEFNSVLVAVGKIRYEHPYEFVHTMNRQFALYYESIYKLKQDNPSLSLYIPCDGLGAASIACLMLNIPYTSFEKYGVGNMAVGLGIITGKECERISGSTLFLGNLSNYRDIGKEIVDEKYCVVDENRLYFGVNTADIKLSTHGKVSSNRILDDVFISGGFSIATSYPMIREKKNIPLSEKAEMYLLESGLPVYTDGEIATCTPSIDGGDSYIDVKDYDLVKIRQVGVCTCDTPFVPSDTYTGCSLRCPNCGVEKFSPYERRYQKYDFFNVVTRNRPKDMARGKIGQRKFCQGDSFLVDNSNEVNASNGFFKYSVRLYENPRELQHYYYVEGFYIGKCRNPKTVRYLYDGGVRKNLMFLRTLDKGGTRYYVFRDVLFAQEIGVLVS